MSRRRTLVTPWLVVGLLVLPGAEPAGAVDPLDRLERFRALAMTRQHLVQAGMPVPHATERELLGLIDEEIVDSLSSGGFFASPEFLQDRLDGFADAWGGAVLRITPFGELTVGAFDLGDGPGASSVRVYGAPEGRVALLGTVSRDGRPIVHRTGPGPGGAPQFLVAWEGGWTGHGTRLLTLDLVRRHRTTVEVAWTTRDLFPLGLAVRSYAVRPGTVRLRYELRYPGWTPGCSGQTEAEEVLSLAGDGSRFVRSSRRDYDSWHRELHVSTTRLFHALATGDRALLVALVPDGGLRQRLPRTLQADAACDAPDDPRRPRSVSIAAIDDGAPWELVWEWVGGRWRLTSASPVVP